MSKNSFSKVLQQCIRNEEMKPYFHFEISENNDCVYSGYNPEAAVIALRKTKNNTPRLTVRLVKDEERVQQARMHQGMFFIPNEEYDDELPY